MNSFLRQHTGAVLVSLALHIAVVALLVVGFRFAPTRDLIGSQQVPIETVLISETMLARAEQIVAEADEAEQRRIDEDARRERERVEAEQQARERTEREARENELRIQQEAEREVAEIAAREEAERLAREEAERVAREDAQRREREEAQRLAREEAERVAREEAERIAREEAAIQRQLEENLQRELDAEAEARRLRSSPEFDLYVRSITDRIERNWIQPASAQAGLECLVNVTQIPGGTVTGVSIGECNGDPAVRRSIDAAVRRASPLPTPPVPALFERELRVWFRPQL